MFSNNPLRNALVASLIIHTALFFKLPLMNFFSRRPLEQSPELTYVREDEALPSLKVYDKIFPKEPSRQLSSKAVAPPPYLRREKILPLPKNVMDRKPEFVSPEIIAVKKKIELPVLEDEKMSNPVYLNYYQMIRERIRRAAYHNYTSLINGEVFLSFIITCEGGLKNTRVDEAKSTPYPYLKEIARKSIYDASPFPAFPKELDYPELSFNVIISFEVE
ncbi:energy transducer TonB [Candidatus Omnitrophota bacterium]